MGKKQKAPKPKPGAKAKPTPQPKPESNIRKARHEDLHDEIDDFSAQRDKIRLQHYNKQGSDEENSDGEPVAVMDLGSDLDDSSGEDIFEAEAKEQYEATREADIAQEEKITKRWNKKDIYGADTTEFELMGDDEDDAEKEEEEALRLQALQAEAFEEADFTQTMLKVKEGKGKAKAKRAQAGGQEAKGKGKLKTKGVTEAGVSTDKKKKLPKAAADHTVSNQAELLAVNAELDDVSLDLGNGAGLPRGGALVKLQKDRSELSKQQQLDVLLTDAPEVFALVEEMEGKIREIQTSLQPTLQQVGAGGTLQTNKGISFLQVKLQLLLSYLTNITFLLMLRAEGRSIKDHPVVAQLAQLRAVMEKIKPVDKKLKYQVDKLLQLGTAPAGQAQEEDDQGDGEVNPLSFKPNPANLRAAEAPREEDGVYRISRVQAKAFDDSDKKTKAQRKEERLKKKMAQSKLVKELRSEIYTDAPERVEVFGDNRIKGDAQDIEKREYEEDMFLRLMETKKERGQRKAKNKITAFEDFDDFGDLAMITEASKPALPTKAELLAGKGKAAKRPAYEMDDDDFMEGFEMYDDVKKTAKAKKTKREEDHPKKESLLSEQDPNEAEAGEPRAIGDQIMKNRGLTRYRPKDKKNPRVRYRQNYEKAMVTRRTQVKEYQGQVDNYGGEATGIKRNIVRSRKLKAT